MFAQMLLGTLPKMTPAASKAARLVIGTGLTRLPGKEKRPGSNKHGSKPVAMMAALKVLDEQTEPITLEQLIDLSNVSRATALRALNEYAVVAGAVPATTSRGMRMTATFVRKKP